MLAGGMWAGDSTGKKDICPKCNNIGFKLGVAIQNTLVGIPDFPKDSHPVTLSYSGTGKLIPCWKCTNCGYSKGIS